MNLELAIAGLLSEPTIAAAAAKIGIGERTLRGWMQQPCFRTAYRLARVQVVEAAIGQLQQGGGRGGSCTAPPDDMDALNLAYLQGAPFEPARVVECPMRMQPGSRRAEVRATKRAMASLRREKVKDMQLLTLTSAATEDLVGGLCRRSERNRSQVEQDGPIDPKRDRGNVPAMLATGRSQGSAPERDALPGCSLSCFSTPGGLGPAGADDGSSGYTDGGKHELGRARRPREQHHANPDPCWPRR
jgi:hypothetical protein